MKNVIIVLLIIAINLFSYSHSSINYEDLIMGSYSEMYPSVCESYTVRFDSMGFSKYNGVKYYQLIQEAINDAKFQSTLSSISNMPVIICTATAPEPIAGKANSIIFQWTQDQDSPAIMSSSQYYIEDGMTIDPDANTNYVNQIRIAVNDDKAADNSDSNLKCTIRHEVLHGLGLGHTWSNLPESAQNKLMYYINLGNRNPYPGSDEINGLLAWYAPVKFKDDGSKILNLLNGQNSVDLHIQGGAATYNVELFFNYEKELKTRLYPGLQGTSYFKSPQCIGGNRFKINANSASYITWETDLKDDFSELIKEEYKECKPYIRMFAENCEDNYHNQQSCIVDIYDRDRAMDELSFNISEPRLKVSNTYFPIFGEKLEFIYFKLQAVDFKGNLHLFEKAEGFQNYIKFVRYKIESKEAGSKAIETKEFGDVYYSDETRYNAQLPGIIFDRTKQYKVTATFFANDGVTEITSDWDWIQPNKISTDYVKEEKEKGTKAEDIQELEIDYTKLNSGILKLKTSSIPINLKSNSNSVEEMPSSIKYLYAKVEDGVIGEYVEIGTSSSFDYDWNLTDFNSGQYVIKVLAKYPSESEYNTKYLSLLPIKLYRPLTLSSAITVFKKPDSGTKVIYGTTTPIQEKDTIRVTVPLAVDPDKWGGVEVLLDGESSLKITPASPAYTSTDTDRIYKFVWDYSSQPEGFVTMQARYKLDPLSYEQKKVKVAFSSVWEDFENGMGNWTLGTNYGYPVTPGHFSVNYNTYTKSNELKVSSGFYNIAIRSEVLSPVIEVPVYAEGENTFLEFDYAREYGQPITYGGRSMMVIQVCGTDGKPLTEEQFYGSLHQTDDDDDVDYPIEGYSLNLPNFFDPNLPGLFGDNTWSKYYFWLNWGSVLGAPYHDFSGQNIRLKFIQLYTVEFVGIIDNWDWSSGTPIWNPTPITLNPPMETAQTYHNIDNFLARTYYTINLPPTIDKVADQEVRQHCGWQKVNLTGITNGENAIYGDDEDLEDQKSKSDLLRNIRMIKDVEQREDGSIKVTALVKEGKDYKDISFNPGALNKTKAEVQKVISLILSCDNSALIPGGNLILEEPYTAGNENTVLKYLPEDTKNGVANITVRVEDDGGTEHNGRNYTEMKFKVTVKPFNPPVYDPPITELDNLVEDFGEINIDLNGHFSDPDASKDLIYYKASCDNSAMMNVTLNLNMLTVKSIKDVFGTCNITIVADDSTGTVPTVVTKTVTIANDGDDLKFSSGYESQELQLPVNFGTKRIDISAQFTNELPDPPVYSVTQTNPAVLDAVFEGSELCLTSKTDVTGITDITVNVASGTRSISSTIKAVAGNLPPEIKEEIADIETDANFKTMYINLKDHYTDPNKDWLGYSVRTTQSKIDTYISFYDDQLIIESKANESGVDSLYISIYDGEFTVRDSLKITIGTPTTQVPYLTAPIPDQRVKEDFGIQTVDLSQHFTDPNGNAIAYIVDFDSTKVKCSIENGILIMKSVKNFHGYAPIHVSIDDGVSKIKDAKFDGCDPKDVVRVREKIKKKKDIKKTKK